MALELARLCTECRKYLYEVTIWVHRCVTAIVLLASSGKDAENFTDILSLRTFMLSPAKSLAARELKVNEPSFVDITAAYASTNFKESASIQFLPRVDALPIDVFVVLGVDSRICSSGAAPREVTSSHDADDSSLCLGT